MYTTNSASIIQFLRKFIQSIKRNIRVRQEYTKGIGRDGSTRYTVEIARR